MTEVGARIDRALGKGLDLICRAMANSHHDENCRRESEIGNIHEVQQSQFAATSRLGSASTSDGLSSLCMEDPTCGQSAPRLSKVEWEACGIPSRAVRCLPFIKYPLPSSIKSLESAFAKSHLQVYIFCGLHSADWLKTRFLMMDGKNSIGRKVSLLNDDSHTAAVLPRLPPLSVYYRATHSHSRSPSLASSTPSVSPQTPRLVRSESSDSRHLPLSPLTPPPTSFDHLHHPKSAHSLYFAGPASFAKMDDSTSSIYPPVPDSQAVAPYPMPVSQPASSTTPAMSQPMALSYQRSSNSPVSESSRAPAANKSSTKKNQYPCPLAKHYNCSDFFTTSGHAARHAKKHTGKKDAFCPECNKAFTRKDNMEQHRRTHQNVRGPSKSSTDGRVKKSTKPAPRKSISGPLEAAAVAQLEEHQSQPRNKYLNTNTNSSQLSNPSSLAASDHRRMSGEDSC
ncbi:unnamed protein product [Aureobasidium pullulans]|nr:unnamed protein product [Aureobasidium pullulans]